MCSSLTVITVVRNPGQELILTLNSLQELPEFRSGLIQWKLLDGSNTFNAPIEIVRNAILLLPNAEVIQISDSGIYDALNQSFRYIETNHFMFLHSGDVLLKSLMDKLPHLSETFVDCFKSRWHEVTGESVPSRDSVHTHPFFGVMPNHQAMIFPRQYTGEYYDLKFPIAADQDLKLRLFKQGLLRLHPEFVVSSLDGGISARKLNRHDVFERTFETWHVLRKHFGVLHCLIAATLHFANYVKRSI
jgi:hypothetical protein